MRTVLMIWALSGCVGSSETRVLVNPEQTPFTQALLDCEVEEKANRCMDAAGMFERGDGTEVSRESACGYYGRACDMAHTPGCTAHGKCMEEGVGDNATMEAAKGRYLTACNRGDRDACVVLLDMLENGREGMEPDPQGAIELLKRGCEAGDAEACARLKAAGVEAEPAEAPEVLSPAP